MASITLGAPYPSRYGAPVVRRVDPAIFRLQFFTHCLACRFCGDACCDHGVDMDLVHRDAVLRHAEGLEAWTGIPRARWFTQRVERDAAFPGGGAVRTRVRGGRCVFLAPSGRGCQIHAYCLAQGLDYHDLKAIVDVLFPISFADDLLCPAAELEDGALICSGQGPTAYQGLRAEVRFYFGDGLVGELDAIEERVMTG